MTPTLLLTALTGALRAALPTLIVAATTALLAGSTRLGSAHSDTRASNRALNAPFAAPDLVPFVEWSPLRPTMPALTSTLTITYGLINMGDAPAVPTTAMEVRLYVGLVQTPTASTPYTHHGNNAVALGAGQRRVFGALSEVLTITTMPPVPVWVWADVDNAVAEGDENNNLAHRFISDDVFEVDDDCLTARPIVMNTPQVHTHWPLGDEDWVGFVADDNRKYTITAQNIGADAEVEIQVMRDCSATTATFASATSPTTTNPSGVQVTWNAMVSGTVYVRVRNWRPTHGPDTAYTLTVMPSDPCYSEPNNTCHTGSPLLVSGLSKQGNFCEIGDRDWHVIEAKAGWDYDLRVSGAAPGVKPQIVRVESASCGDAPVFGGGEQIIYTADRDGPVHVLIENKGTQFGLNSDYLISATVAGCARDSQEPNNKVSEATPIKVNESVKANGCPAADFDWFVVDAIADTPYFVETLPSVVSEMQGDTQLAVYDSEARTVLASDDDSGPGLGALVQVPVGKPGKLYIKVWQTDPAQAGPATAYTLSVRDTPCARDANEPNDIAASATELISGTASANTLCPEKDKDYFEATLLPGTYSLWTSDLGVAADTTLALYDETGAHLIQFNDDYEPKGLGSGIEFLLTTTRKLLAVVAPRTASTVSSGVHYSLTLQAGPLLTATHWISDEVLLDPTPIESQINTLIVTNRAQLETVFGFTPTQGVMNVLDVFKNHASVRGEVLDVSLNSDVRAAYGAWASHPNSSTHAIAVAREIQRLIVSDIVQRRSIQYLVIVGDDRIVPFHRLPDASHRFSEATYAHTPDDTAVAQAQRDNYFLSDDCYSAARLLQRAGQNWCLPQLATGRLVETPDEIVGFINRYLQGGLTVTLQTPHIALVGGYDFVKDSADDTCQKLRLRFDEQGVGPHGVRCDLIGDFASLASYQSLMLNATPPYALHSLNGHGTHFAFGINARNETITASDVWTAASAPALVWTPACHVGLNVPDSAAANSFDLPQAYARRGVNLIANTGYGWGRWGGQAYSEQMVKLLASAFTRAGDVQIGPALRRAKWRYYSEQHNDDALHPKVAMQMTLFGLPMVKLHWAGLRLEVEGTQTDDDGFPSMVQSSAVPFSSNPPDGLVSTLESFGFKGNITPSIALSATRTVSDTYFALDGRVNEMLGNSIQPRYYYSLPQSNNRLPARSAWVLTTTFETVQQVTAMLTTAHNEYGEVQTQVEESAWDNDDPIAVRALPEGDTLVAAMGQANPSLQAIRLTKAMSVEVYYSRAEDMAPPRLVSLQIHRTGQRHDVKAKLDDTNALVRVGMLFTDGSDLWRTQDLAFDVRTQSWKGTITMSGTLSFALQALDSAGNIARFTHKGRYFHPGIESPVNLSYMPLLAK